ncbi:hypothetical protein [Bordetella hinzii]|uniref:hypothetical protein n=1 Tax=Bordetella hinzii TaxID=103855 RepID=UPI000764B8FD|nr:hypothetical protein [Bordetella hinzii]KXA71092.1 hypothetical protein AXA74_20535 [Bordetella hinzii LMG 13501]VEH23205.1 Uncharacterised protein [Bordetella hinzii]VEH33530.1 Uncharacterised protein [Bordetella hinzii]
MSADLLAELRAAHQIIRNALSLMTAAQKHAWGVKNAADSVDGEGITRANERAAAIARAEGSLPLPRAFPAPLLYQHDDGRYGLSFGPARFAVAAPAWHRVPLDLIEFPPRACLAPASPSPASPATHP